MEIPACVGRSAHTYRYTTKPRSSAPSAATLAKTAPRLTNRSTRAALAHCNRLYAPAHSPRATRSDTDTHWQRETDPRARSRRRPAIN